MATRALSRIVRPGCKSGFACSCARISGDAFTSTQELPTPTAMEDWVRARPRSVPARYPLQLGQLQFHCGKPPPAADPSTRIFKGEGGAVLDGGRQGRTPRLISDWTHTS